MLRNNRKTVTQLWCHLQAVEAPLGHGVTDRLPSRGKRLVIMLWHAYFEALML